MTLKCSHNGCTPVDAAWKIRPFVVTRGEEDREIGSHYFCDEHKKASEARATRDGGRGIYRLEFEKL